jgi:hypothetical protein
MAHRNVTRALDAIEMKHAVDGAIVLFDKLREFERRALAAEIAFRPPAVASDPPAGDVTAPLDEAALLIALRQLVQLLAPMAPHLAEELWALSGEEQMLATLPWPEPVPRTSAPQRVAR